MTLKDIVKFQDTPIANFNPLRELKLSALWALRNCLWQFQGQSPGNPGEFHRANFANAKFGFIEQQLLGVLSFLKESIFADEYAAKDGFLQSLDARIKVITFLLFILTILFTKSVVISFCLYAVCLVLTYFSNVNLGFFLKRTWIFIPIFSLFIAIPAIFSIFTPGETLFVINVIGAKLIITRQGLFGAILFVSRVIASVSFAVLLSITTRHFELLKVLRIFKIPQIFVMVFGMCWRYIYLFVEIIENTYFAVKSRVGTKFHYKKGQHIVTWNIACLWQRSCQFNEEVYQAMLSRGYNGEPLILDDFKIRLKDKLWLFAVLVVFVFGIAYRLARIN